MLAGRPHTNGVYLDRSFGRRGRRGHWRTQAVPLRIPADPPAVERPPHTLLDVVFVVMVGFSLGASLLLGIALLLGAAWVVVWLALELARLVGRA
jgi:hypothetical protein